MIPYKILVPAIEKSKSFPKQIPHLESFYKGLKYPLLVYSLTLQL